MSRFDLEDRLSGFAGDVVLMTKGLKQDMANEYLSKQLVRASCSAALNYGEVQGTLSKKDYKFKAALVLKELKETRAALKIVVHISGSGKGPTDMDLLGECEELIAIVATLIKNR